MVPAYLVIRYPFVFTLIAISEKFMLLQVVLQCSCCLLLLGLALFLLVLLRLLLLLLSLLTLPLRTSSIRRFS